MSGRQMIGALTIGQSPRTDVIPEIQEFLGGVEILQAGALVTNPSCGACIGASSLLAPGEVCISTSNRNFRGRMGSIDAEIYLASPATVARSALAGHITAEED